MNKLFKRTTAFVLMVCLLCALAVPAVYAAPAEADKVVYNFELDQTDYKWLNYSFGGTNLNHGNSTWVSCMDEMYENGTINWNYPHIVDTQRYELDEFGNPIDSGEDRDEDGITDPVLNDTYGKVINAQTFKSHEKNPNQFGGTHYSNGSNLGWTGLKLHVASKAAAGLDNGWNALLLKAPAAGTYAVALEYTKYAAAATSTDVYMLPYTAELKAQVAADPDGFNAYITALTAGDANKMGSFASWISAGAETGQIADLGKITVSAVYDEYLLVLANAHSKASYIQELTLTPAAEEVHLEGAQEAVNKTYAFQASGTVNMSTPEGLATANALSADWDYLGFTSFKANGNPMTVGRENLTKSEAQLYGAGSNWKFSFKIASPGAGTFDLKMSFKDGTTTKTQVWTSMYIAAYTEGMDVADIANMTKVGEHHPLVKDINTSKHESDVIGQFTFEADKDYVLVLAADQADYIANKEYDTDGDGVTDVFMTNNLYLYNIIAYKDAVEGAPAPRAYIGATSYGTVAAALAAAKSGDVIKLAADFTGTVDLPAGVSLDLNGYTLDTQSIVTTAASEKVFDSKGTGKLIAKEIDLFASNDGKLPLATADNTYSFVDYELTVNANDYEANGAKTRFWFKLDMADADLDKIAAGNTGLTIGVELAWEGGSLDVTFAEGEDEAAFAAAWAAAYKQNKNIWLYVDIAGLTGLESDLTVKPVLNSADSTLYTGSIVYTVG